MKRENLPEFAKIYKTKGYDVRKRNDIYYLYKITSVCCKEKKYPVLKQEYIGVIDPIKGLIRKETNISINGQLLEYGYSHFLYVNFAISIRNSSFTNTSPDFVKACVLYYIYKTTDERVIKLSSLYNEQIKGFFKTSSIKRIQSLSNKLDILIKSKITNDADLKYISFSLMNIMAINNKRVVEYADYLLNLLSQYGFTKYE